MFPSIVSSEWLSEAVRILTAGTYVLIAGSVTVHALLRKKDVRAALGWIAVAWLSPILGGLLYYVFGINRVTRRALRIGRRERSEPVPPRAAERLAVAANIAALADIGQRVTGVALTAGNGISLLHGGDEAYPAMLAAIRGARHSVALTSYIFRDDTIGSAFVEALADAQKRSVTVRVLLDGIGSGYVFCPALHRLRHGGVVVARFMHTWVPWRMPFLNMRNHKKLLIADGVLAFTGGLNIGAENTANANLKTRVDDIHLRIEGPVVAQLMDTFAQDWSFTTEESLDRKTWWPTLDARGTVFARGIRSGPDADIDTIETILGAALAQARERVRIITPYFLPDQRLEFAIEQAGLRGVTIDIVLPERSDYAFLDWAMRAHLRFLGEVPVNVHFGPLPFDHAKLMTVDGEWCLVGSSNWDTRSLRLNFEFDVECYDRALVESVDTLIDRKIARSVTLRRDKLMASPRWLQLRDAAIRLLLPYL